MATSASLDLSLRQRSPSLSFILTIASTLIVGWAAFKSGMDRRRALFSTRDREIYAEHIRLACADTVAAAVTVVVILGGTRVPHLLKDLSFKRGYYAGIGKALFLTVLDWVHLPFLLLLLALPWRLPGVFRRTVGGGYVGVHFELRCEAFGAVVDVPCFAAGLFVLGTGWRARSLLRNLGRVCEGRAADWMVIRVACLGQFWELVLDVAHLPCLVVLLCLPWRIPFCYAAEVGRITRVRP
jgi:hypothetical protein